MGRLSHVDAYANLGVPSNEEPAWISMYTKDRYTGKKLLKAPLKLVGAKSKTRDTLYALFPDYYKYYVEPFMGSGSVFMGHIPPSGPEYVGDLNEYAIDFYQILQEDPDAFWTEYQDQLHTLQEKGKDYFLELRYWLTRSFSKTERAVFFYLITKVAMNGIIRFNKRGECNSSYCGTAHGRGWMDLDWFKAVTDRIEFTRFRSCSYSKLPVKSESFVFCDPPYHESTGCYMSSWKEQDFKTFADYIIESSKAVGFDFMITLNDTPFIRELFKEQFITPHPVHYSCSQTPNGRGIRPELIITNYNVTWEAKAIGLI